jgi:hypothetical protein
MGYPPRLLVLLLKIVTYEDILSIDLRRVVRGRISVSADITSKGVAATSIHFPAKSVLSVTILAS